jgi:hypothetical protein
MRSDGQMPLPFKRGTQTRPPPRTWKTRDGAIARVCPECGCNRDRRCKVTLGDDGEGVCVPAGLFGSRVCSACVPIFKVEDA